MKRFLLLLAALLATSNAPVFSKSASQGAIAPPYSIKLLNKQKITSADMAGKVVVINYWATWCGPCKAEMPMMHRYFRKHQAEGLQIFGVVTKDSVPAYRLATVASILSYPLATSLSGNYGIVGDAVPTSYIIDRKGVIRLIKVGGFDEAEFSAAVEPLLAEKAAL